jgi:pseudaminic acid biosynthesis-associated methylase
MLDITKQMDNWMGDFGNSYTTRNTLTLEQIDELYKKQYGINNSELNELFLGDLNRNIWILEVGSNIGNKLLSLQKMGFKNLYGIEINSQAIEQAKANTKNINIIHGSALDIPFKDAYFDLVFTSGVLIHISPADIKRAISEIYRCSKKYIWGFEYYADAYTEIEYRGHSKLMWKADFAKLYFDQFKDLELIKEKRLKYLDDNNIDTMYLLMKARCFE